MGEITVRARLRTSSNRVNWEDGRIEESEIRTYTLDATVDTGAVMLVLPQNVVEKLGVRNRRTVIVSYADERKEERPVAGPLTIKLGDRFMTTDCIVGPPLSEPLVGQVVLEEARSARRLYEPQAHPTARVSRLSTAQAQVRGTGAAGIHAGGSPPHRGAPQPELPKQSLLVRHHELRPVRRGRVVTRVVAEVVVARVVVVIQVEIDAELRRPRLVDRREA